MGGFGGYNKQHVGSRLENQHEDVSRAAHNAKTMCSTSCGLIVVGAAVLLPPLLLPSLLALHAQVCVCVTLVPKEEADKMKLGSGRSNPNHSPFCPPPTGALLVFCFTGSKSALLWP